MKVMAIVTGWVVLFSTLTSGQAGAQRAQAELRNAKGEEVGVAMLMEVPGGVKITLHVWDIPPGVHGFHIHAVGKCEPPSFTSAGGHLNPHGKKHGLKNPEGAHAGDLPNLLVGPDGIARMEVLAPYVTLGAGPHSLFHPGGAALVIHADPDDEVTDPAGNAGARIACGIITE